MSTLDSSAPRLLSAVLCGVVLLLAVGGCDEETLGPEMRGTIKGTVQDAETNAPLANASVTTSPPTQSVLTDENGAFTIEDVPEGNYTIEANKTDYVARSVQVKVQGNQTTSAVLLLQLEEDAKSSGSDSLTARVTNWYNARVNRDSTGADSIFANVEYEVRNVGEERIRDYEVYFEIDTPEGNFSYEASGDSLDVGQRDIREFRKYITAEARAVRVDDTYWQADE